MAKPRITKVRQADVNHVVTTVEGGGDRYRRKPCDTCPWRRDAVGIFPAEAFRLSANTGRDGSNCLTEDLLAEAMHTFACHTNGVDKTAICAGYILRGEEAVGWRIAVATGKFDPAKVSDGGAELFENYFQMAVANGVPPDDPAIATCRPWRHEEAEHVPHD